MEKKLHPLNGVKYNVDKTLLTLPVLIPIERNLNKRTLSEWAYERLYSIEDSSVLVEVLCARIQNANILESTKTRAIDNIKRNTPKITNSAIFPRDVLDSIFASFEKTRESINKITVAMFEDASSLMQEIIGKCKETSNIEKKKKKFKRALGYLDKKLEAIKSLLVLYDEYLAILYVLDAFQSIFSPCKYKKGLEFVWSYSHAPNIMTISTLTDELILCHYNIFVFRLEIILGLTDQKKQSTFNTVVIREGFEGDANPRLSDELGICSYILKTMVEIGNEQTPPRYSVVASMGILPNVKQVDILARWLFVAKRDAVFSNDYENYFEPENASKLAEFSKLMSVLSDKIVCQMVTVDKKQLSHEYRGLSFILKWSSYAIHFYNMVSELAMMIHTHEEKNFKKALMWRDKLMSSLSNGKNMKAFQKQMKEFHDIAGQNNNAFASGFFVVDRRFFNAVKQQESSQVRCSIFQLFDPSLSLVDVIFYMPHTRCFDTDIYFKVHAISKQRLKLIKEDNKLWMEEAYVPRSDENMSIKYDTKGPDCMELKPFSVAIPVEIPSSRVKLIYREKFQNFTNALEAHIVDHFDIFVEQRPQPIDLKEEMKRLNMVEISVLFDKCDVVSKQLKTIQVRFSQIKSEILEGEQARKITQYLLSMDKMWSTMKDEFSYIKNNEQSVSESDASDDVDSDVDVESEFNSAVVFKMNEDSKNTIEYMANWLAIATKSIECFNQLEKTMGST
jgi:hypothetical protein